MRQCVCKKECFIGNRLYSPGDGKILTVSDDEEVPMHFEELPTSVAPEEMGDKAAIRRELIKETMFKMNPDNEEHWTKSGQLSVIALEEVLGFQVTRAEMEAIVPGFKKDLIAYKADRESEENIMG